MRTIKFRGKRVDGKGWCRGLLALNKGDENSYFLQSPLYDSDGYRGYQQYEVTPETVGQFTGSTDKNGKEIYDGDICKVLYSSIGFQIDVMGVVYWGDWSMSYQIYLLPNQDEYKLADYKSDIEVIGNINDNPELLGGSK